MQNNTPTIPVAILGATGAVGQRFVQLLDRHPWFRVTALTGPDRLLGQPYGQSCHWVIPAPMPDWARDLPVLPSLPDPVGVSIAFSALPPSAAHEVEPAYAQNGTLVCSNASAFRMEPEIPLILPEVNPDHTCLIERQRELHKWSGAIVKNPNCTITGVTVILKVLADRFGVDSASIVSLQAVSGAGYPGVPSMDILGNVLPFIDGEEEKMELEPRKMLGKINGGRIEMADITLSAQANRVPIQEGHMVCMSVKCSHPADLESVSRVLIDYQVPSISSTLPSTPQPVIVVKSEPDRPQPRLDAMLGGGMSTVVGRLRSDSILDYKLVILSHNTIRGAAGGSIYNAELLVSQGFIA